MLTIDRCLDAIATHTKEKYKIYIFDNGSTDKEFLKHLDTISDRKIIIKKNKKMLVSDRAEEHYRTCPVAICSCFLIPI